MKLQQLLQDLSPLTVERDREITGISLHSQQVQSGELFVALKGTQHIQQAMTNGAVAALCDVESDLADFSIPVIAVPGLAQQLDTLAIRFYGSLATMPIIGITGTNGKTTTSYLLAQCLSYLGQPCAVIGTLGCGFVDDLTVSHMTTPDIFSLQKTVKALKNKGAQAIAMEVSSHGLMQGRVALMGFSSAIFTNLTQDHLDYHGNMISYGQAKQKLFEFQSLAHAIINADADYADTMLGAIKKNIPITLCSIHSATPLLAKQALASSMSSISTITVEKFQLSNAGITATLNTPKGQGVLRSSLLGEFNLSNLLLVLAELLFKEIPLADALKAISAARAAPGRMQRLGKPGKPLVIIDYAHTPDALENALKAARLHCEGRLWCVFGCGGDRDQFKRSQMGEIAARWACSVVITNDNPRTESPENIIANIVAGIRPEHSSKVVIETDRQKAIEYAVKNASAKDTILIAGKGHEDYQIIGTVKYPFSDEACVKELWGEE